MIFRKGDPGDGAPRGGETRRPAGDAAAAGVGPAVAAEAGQAGAARLLLEYGADVSAQDLENDANALGGTRGRWLKFSNATLEDWGRAAEMIRARGGIE